MYESDIHESAARAAHESAARAAYESAARAARAVRMARNSQSWFRKKF